MSKPWRLTRTAEASLAVIARWTYRTYGLQQSITYENRLIAACQQIAAGVAVTRDCRRMIDPDLPENLRFTRAGAHFVIFIEIDEQIIIVEFAHVRSDLPRRLAALARPGVGRVQSGSADPS